MSSIFTIARKSGNILFTLSQLVSQRDIQNKQESVLEYMFLNENLKLVTLT